MKNLLIITISILFATSCTDKKKEQPEMIPVEADNGIGDGASSLDSLLKEKEDNSFISEEKSDSITNSHIKDSI